MKENKENLKAIIILGGGLTSDFKLNEHTRQRFDTAIPLLKNYDIIICSSDKSYRKLDEIRHTSEARVGRDYLISKGINPDKIYLEEKSRDTISNAYYCRKDIINNTNIKDICIITSKFHMPKTKFVFELVFPKEEFNLDFIESPNGLVDDEQLKSREISEQIILDFYKEELCDKYKIIPGDIKSIGNYIMNHNPSVIGKKDELHEKLTQNINKQISGKNPLY